MSRGDRSRPGSERTAEERERDREQRALRRAERSGGAADDPSAAPDGDDAAFAAAREEPVALPDTDHAPASDADEHDTHAPGADEREPDEHAVGDGSPPEPPPVTWTPLEPAEPVAERPTDAEPAAGAEPLEPSAGDRSDEPYAPDELHKAHEPPAASAPPEALAPDEHHEAQEAPAAAARTAAVAAGAAPAAGERGAASARTRASESRAGSRRSPGAPAGGAHRRSGPARVAAIVALLAAIAAVVLVARALTGSSHSKSAAAPKVIRVLIPEGKTRAQIAQIAKTAGLSGSYRLASRRSPLLDPTHYGAPHGTPSLEGFLFPATYDVNAGEATSRLVQEQLIAFRENFGATEAAHARALHVTPYQLLTVASMVEREAQVPSDRAKIAAVIYNRLRAGIPLGIDATIYYAVEQQAGIATYTHELTEAQLHIDSPYNTRLHTGLPPTPISNPGAASIQAAAHPAQVSYLYYVAGADGCGEQVFSTTLASFEANAAAYQAAVRKNGGHPPSCKHK